MSSKKCLAAFLLCCFATADGYRIFQDRIPNGGQLPHPCLPNYVWHGVGHLNDVGGGVRNQFGKDFHENGQVWDECLCQVDSDGDGRTNGEELGDPDCVWSLGELPARTTGITHPGLCEPIDNALCIEMNAVFGDFCVGPPKLDCDAMHDPDVRTMTLRPNYTQVSTEKVHYYCSIYDVPYDQDYHIVAYEGLINNSYALHHINFYGCREQDGIGNLPERQTPSDESALTWQGSCSDLPVRCRHFLDGWILGISGVCWPNDNIYAFPMGKSYFTRIALNTHWVNPEQHDGYWDNSGLKIYYTPKLRQYNIGILENGPTAFALPPGQTETIASGNCKPSCLANPAFTEPVHIFATFAHMHYRGRQSREELYRGNESFVFFDLPSYQYDHPYTIYYDPPIELRPGDGLKTTCVFNTLLSDRFTYYGAATDEEMCFNYHYYYPAADYLEYCLPFGDDDISCGQIWPGAEEETVELYNQALDLFNGNGTRHLIENVLQTCDHLGARCLQGCQANIDAVLSSGHPSVRPPSDIDYTLYIIRRATRDPVFTNTMRSCEFARSANHRLEHKVSTLCEDTTKPPSAGMSYGHSSKYMNLVGIVILIKLMMLFCC